jgi:hypothetical protein
MAKRVPVAIVRAAEKCGTRAWDQSRTVIQRWLEDGGNPNQDLHEDVEYFYNFKLLLVAASSGRTDVVRLLLEHGADINHCFHYPDGYVDPRTGPMTALVLAADNLDLTRLLLDNGPEDVRICVKALSSPRLVRMLLVAGADVSARSCKDKTPEMHLRWMGLGERCVLFREYTETLRILEGTRLAGSYKNYVLQDFKGLLRLRSLLARGRASFGPTTPEVVARLFGGRTAGRARPPTRRHRPPPTRTQGVPDPVFWKVMEYWRLGDWRHP